MTDFLGSIQRVKAAPDRQTTAPGRKPGSGPGRLWAPRGQGKTEAVQGPRQDVCPRMQRPVLPWGEKEGGGEVRMRESPTEKKSQNDSAEAWALPRK